MAPKDVEQGIEAMEQQLNGAATFISLTVLFVMLKLFTHRDKDHNWINLTIVAALVIFIVLCVFAIVDAKAYMTYFLTDNKAVQEAAIVRAVKSVYAMSILYPLASALPKIFLCLLYIRIFRVHRRLCQVTYGIIAFLVINTIAWLIPAIFVCRPISAYWSPHSKNSPAKCINFNYFGTWISLPNIVSDLVILATPIPLLWNLQMSKSKKLGVIFTFAVGALGILGACLRFGSYVHRTYVERPGTNQSTASTAFDVIVTYVECGMYLIAACLPTLRSFVTQLSQIASGSLSSILRRRPSYNSDGVADRPRIRAGGNPGVQSVGRRDLDTAGREVDGTKIPDSGYPSANELF